METKEKKARPATAKTVRGGIKPKITKEEAKRRAKAKEEAKLKAESRERAKRRAARKAKEQEERTQRIEAGRRRSAERSQRRQVEKKRTVKRPVLPEVVYTAPKPFSSTAFLLRLATVVTVVLALTFCVSIFFKVETVNVSGNAIYSAWDVMNASGIQQGDSLLGLAKAKASGRITASLPYVQSVRIGIHLPGTVNIEITESEVLYAVQSEGGDWWLITAAGKVVDRTIQDQTSYAKILGVGLAEPKAGEQAVAAEQPVSENVISSSERLAAAMGIIHQLESCGMISGVASIDVEDTASLELWYGTQYRVLLGDVSRLDYKIACLKAAVEQMEDYRSGVLDISFTTWPDQPAYTPFSED